MDKQPLITVVIPIYNVEQYLKRCLDSIIYQTYTNLEIILVDDGSKDSSGAICDDYARKDARIKVVHKQNAGVSAARNDGIREGKGEYILFVDSDDCISKDYIEYLYLLIKNNECEISGCSYLIFRDELKNEEIVEDIRIFTNVQAFDELCYQRSITTSPWGKMFKKELFQGIEFPIGVNCGEDLAIIYKVLYKARKVVVSNKKKYYYFQRANSLINSNFSSKRMKSIEFAKEIVKFAGKYLSNNINSAINRLFMEAIFIYIQIPQSKYKDEQKLLKKVIRENRKTVLKDRKSKKGYRLIALFSFFGMWTIRVLFNIKNKIGG